MRIEKIEMFSYQAPLSRPFAFSQWWFTKRSAFLVKIVLENGTEGWGEVYAHVQPSVYAGIIKEVLASIYLGQNVLHMDVLWERAYNRTRDYGQKGMVIHALSGLDIAAWDAAGKLLDQPVSVLLGGRNRERIEAYATGLYRTQTDDLPSALAEEAKDYVSAGFRVMKMKVGYGIDSDIENIRAVRDAAGAAVGLAIDANHAYDSATAISLGRRAHEYNILWFEEPVAPEDKIGYAEVRERQPIPVSGGEAEHTRYGFRDLLQARGVDISQPDLGGMGGISEGRKVVTLAGIFGIRSQPHVWGTAVAMAASLHVISWMPDVPGSANPVEPMLEWDQTEHPVRDLLTDLPSTEMPWVNVPDDPGLGITVNTDRAAKFLIDHSIIGIQDVAGYSSTVEQLH